MPVNTYYSQARGGYANLCDKHMAYTNDELELMDIEFICETTEFVCDSCDCE